jgi:hypothetical protein
LCCDCDVCTRLTVTSLAFHPTGARPAHRRYARAAPGGGGRGLPHLQRQEGKGWKEGKERLSMPIVINILHKSTEGRLRQGRAAPQGVHGGLLEHARGLHGAGAGVALSRQRRARGQSQRRQMEFGRSVVWGCVKEAEGAIAGRERSQEISTKQEQAKSAWEAQGKRKHQAR